MKTILLTTTVFLSTSSFASSVADKLPGIYTAKGNCKSTMWVYRANDRLEVSTRTDNGEWLFAVKVQLGTGGQSYDCRRGGTYGQLECRVRERAKSITLHERGCLIFCGPWRRILSIEDLGESNVAVKWSDKQTEACVYQKSLN